jgi:hypothetical protein
MSGHPEVAELLERYMEDTGRPEHWLTVKDLRTHFHLDESTGPAIAGFLGKIHHGSCFACRYRVQRIEKFRDAVPPYRIIKRYLVQKRLPHKTCGNPATGRAPPAR